MKKIRKIITGDAITWFKAQQNDSLDTVVVGPPDIRDMDMLLTEYLEWYREVVDLTLRKTKPDGFTIFYHTDRKELYNGETIQKADLTKAAAQFYHRIKPLWHTIAIKHPPGTIDKDRNSYTNILCYTKQKQDSHYNNLVDLIEDGKQYYPDSMGESATEYIIKFINQYKHIKNIIIPFSGSGTVPAMANKYGLNAIGIDCNWLRNETAKIRKI